MSQNNNQFSFDSRVRERLIKQGVLDTKELDKHLQSLKDLDVEVDEQGKKLHYEVVDVPQPALGQDDE